MPLRRHIVGGDEHPPQVVRNPLHVVEPALCRHFFHQLGRIDPTLTDGSLEGRLSLGKLCVVHHVADERQCEDRLDAAGTARDDGNGTGRCNRGESRVPDDFSSRLPGALRPVRERPAVGGEVFGSLDCLLVDETHDLVAQPDRLVGVVSYAEGDEHVRPTHHSQADLSIAFGHLLDLRQGIAVHVDDVIEEVHRRPGGPAQPVPVDCAILDHQLQIERPQVAAFVRK